ncbi:hypothetical protein ACQKWADRAFT_124046 [Trichoderma austrokoningii]
MTVKTRCQRRAPFLHRNWIKGTRASKDSAAMGNIVSSPIHKGSHQIDHERGPPLKRRRVSTPESFPVDHLIASPQSSDSRSALRVEVLKLSHKDSKKIRTYHGQAHPHEVTHTKASCRITISELTPGFRPRVVHCQSQICSLTTYKNPAGPHRVARIDLPKPFYVPQESILVNRVDDDKFDLADSYDVVVELEAARGEKWPPLDSTDFGIAPASPDIPTASSKSWVLSSRFDKIFGRHKCPVSLCAGYSEDELPLCTDYVMDVDLRWAAGYKALKVLEKGSMPCINAVDPETDLADDLFAPSMMRRANGINGHLADEFSVEIDEEGLDGPEGAQTPSRSLRTREKNKVYNLKVLSDQAQGREKKRRARANHFPANEGRVSYLLPSDQPVCLDYYRCVTCGAYHQTMQQLQAHLQTFHPAYDYVLETTSQGPQFRVSSRCEAMVSPLKEYEINPPVKPFNLETFLVGDQSWVSSRLGSDTIDDVFTFSKDRNAFDRLPSQSPVATHPRFGPRRLGQENEKILVPDIRQALFDPISRARLIPGQEVPKRILDNTWLIQKHRESTSDFSDVTPAEKEYIWEWDGYILRQNLTSAAYFPRAWLGFVREKASWLVAAEQRLLEFGKHLSLLRVRDMLEDKVMRDAFSLINEARARLQRNDNNEGGDTQAEEESPKQSPRATQIRKGTNGCTVCQLPVLGPRMLVCTRKVCPHRLYHSDCIREEALVPVDKKLGWLCNVCFESKST